MRVQNSFLRELERGRNQRDVETQSLKEIMPKAAISAAVAQSVWQCAPISARTLRTRLTPARETSSLLRATKAET
jgi:hypothetical protein